MPTYKRLLLCYLLSLLCASSQADAYVPLGNLISLGSEDGLSSSTVYHAFQDRKGFIWFGTEFGVYKYDGFDMEHYSELEGLPDNAIIRIKEDEDGLIWFFSTNGKPSFYYQGQIYSEKNLELFHVFGERKHIWDIAKDAEDNYWIAVNNAAMVRIGLDGQVDHFPVPSTPVQMGNALLFESLEDEMWVFSSGGLIPTNGDMDRVAFIDNGEPRLSGRYHRRADGTELLATFDRKIVHWDGEGFRDFMSKPLPAEILYLLEDSQDRLWVGTRKGLYVGKGNDLELYLPDLSFTSILEDREGNIWFTTLTEGVKMLPRFRMFSPDHPDLYGKVQRIEGDHNRVWIGFEGGRFVEFSGQGMESYDLSRFHTGLPFLWDFLPLDSTAFLVSFDTRAYLVRDERTIRLPLQFGPKQCVSDGNGGLLALYPYRLIRYNSNDLRAWENDDLEKLYQDDNFLSPYFMSRTVCEFRGSALYRLDPDRFLVAGVDRLHLLEHGKMLPVPDPLSPIRVRTSQFLETGSGLWISTLGQGAFHWDGASWFQLGTHNGLLDPHCTTIFEDEEHDIWVGTPRGLHLIPHGYQTPMRYFTTRNGLPSDEITGIGQKGDSLWIGTAKGLCRFDLSHLNEFLDPPQVSVSTLRRNGKLINSLRPPELYSQDHIDVRIAAISFRNQGRVLHRYRLEKDGISVVDSGITYEGQLSFHGLSTGKYKLFVEASNGGEVWGEPVDVITFQVKHPPNSFRWTFLVVLIVVLGSVGALIRWTRRRGEEERTPDHWVSLKVDGKTRMVRTSDIFFVKASGDFVEVFLAGEKLLYRSTMKSMTTLLKDDPLLVRVHRSYLVNLSRVQSFSPRELELDGHTIPLSKSYRGKVIPLLEKHVHSS